MIAIIGVLIALLLPAVQGAREAARRASARLPAVQLIDEALQRVETRLLEAQPLFAIDRGEEIPLELGEWLVETLPFIEQEQLYLFEQNRLLHADGVDQRLIGRVTLWATSRVGSFLSS